VAQGLHLVLAQRLVRQLCRYCKRGVTPTAEEQQTLAEFGLQSDKIYEPAGCPRCLGTGYAGRRAFFELLVSNDRLRDAILHSPSMKEIQAALAETKFKRLQHSGYQLVSEGVVAYTEIERAVGR
jgi:type II secretory ATPase GspE/PulE/Tfp pilus assembly ATPase PilB-like protein